jgi:hypothetical protein
VLLPKDSVTAPELASTVFNLPGVDTGSAEVSYRRLRVAANPEALAEIVKLDGVKAIEKTTQATFGNNLARVDIYADCIVPQHDSTRAVFLATYRPTYILHSKTGLSPCLRSVAQTQRMIPMGMARMSAGPL